MTDAAASSDAQAQSSLSPKAVVRRLMDNINKGDFAAALELIAHDAVDYTAPPGLPPGREGWRVRWQGMGGVLPDMHTKIEQMVEEGEWVATRSSVTATPAAGFIGQKTGGKRFEVIAFDMMRIRGGKVVEHWGLGDQGAMIAQLGLVVSSPEA